MDNQRKQPEGMSRQAVCILGGALAGFALAARLIFDDYGSAGQVPWAAALGIILGGCVVGFFVGILFAGRPPEQDRTAPPERLEDGNPAPPQGPPDQRVKPEDP